MIYIIGIGSNMSSKHGSSIESLKVAIRKLNRNNVRVIKKSFLYSSPPKDFTTAANTFFNGAIMVDSSLKPESLLLVLKKIEKDLFYSEREEYKSVDIATPRQESEKQGVKPAIDDFIASSLWEGKSYNDMAAIILYREDVWQPIHRISPPGTLLRDCKFKVERLERSNHSMPDSPVLRNTRSFPSPVVKFKSL